MSCKIASANNMSLKELAIEIDRLISNEEDVSSLIPILINNVIDKEDYEKELKEEIDELEEKVDEYELILGRINSLSDI